MIGLTVKLKVSDMRGLFQDLLLLILSLAVQDEKLIAPIELDIVGQAAWGAIGLWSISSADANCGSTSIDLAHLL